MAKKPLSIINCEDYNMADVILMGVPYDGTSSFGKGADKGPEATIQCLNTQIEFLEPRTHTTPRDVYKIAEYSFSKMRGVSPVDMVNIVSERYRMYIQRNQFIIMLGGEHSVSNGAFTAIASTLNPREVTILQIDAHLDLRDDDSDFHDPPFGKYSHACVMRRALDLGFRIVNVGARAYSQEEYKFTDQLSSWYPWELIQEMDKSLEISDIISSITTEDVYITLDVDGIDPSHMPATGTPVQGGLEWYFTLNLLQGVFEAKNVIGADIVEVAPRPNDNLTEYGAAQICYSMMGFKLAKEQK